MKRSFILCSLLSLLALGGVAHASIQASCTAKLVKPDQNGEQVTSGYTSVYMASEHTFTVTGGTANDYFFVEYVYSVGVDGSGLDGGHDDTPTGLKQFFDELGIWKLKVIPTGEQTPSATIKASTTVSLSNGWHTFTADSYIKVRDHNSDSKNDSRQHRVGPFTTTTTPGGPPTVGE